jgi:hypothetical protein
MGKVFNEVCPHCGRRWLARGGWIGFMRLPVETHIFCCKDRTPAERRAVNERDAKRWEKRPPRAKISIDPFHPGLRD